MRVHCPICAGEILAGDVNITKLVAKCNSCNNVFEVEAAPGHRAASHRQPQARPDAVQITRQNGGVQLSVRWYSPIAWLMIALTLNWYALSFIALALSVLFFGLPNFSSASLSIGLSLLTLSPLLWGGLLLTYITAALLFNSTVISVDGLSVQIMHKPLPWPGAKATEVSQIDQLYSGEHLTGRRLKVRRFAVYALVKEGKGQQGIELVVKNLKSAEHALYLEQQIESFLGIADERVKGELQQ